MNWLNSDFSCVRFAMLVLLLCTVFHWLIYCDTQMSSCITSIILQYFPFFLSEQFYILTFDKNTSASIRGLLRGPWSPVTSVWNMCPYIWTSLLNYFPWTSMHDLCPTDCLPVSYETIDISPFLGRSTSFSRVSLFNVCAFIRHARPPVASPECWLARPCRGQLSLWCCTGFLQWRNDATALPL